MTGRPALSQSPAWLLVPIVAVRAAGLVFGALDIDECDFLVAGRMMAGGDLPYVGFVEKKPLLSFLFYAPVALTGFHFWLMQLLAIAWVFGTCLLVAQAAREHAGGGPAGEEAGWVAGWLACLAHVACVPAVNCETMLNLPAAAAILFFVRAERSGRLRDNLWAGVAVGISTLFKQQAGILLVSLVASLVFPALLRRAGPPRGARALVLGAGFTAPWAAVAGLYAALGQLGPFVYWNVTRNLAYQAHSGGSSLGRLAFGLFIGIALAAPVQWALAVGETVAVVRGRVRDPVRRALVLALWLTFVPVSLGGRFYNHYFIQFAPLVALVALPGAQRLLAGWSALGRRRRWLYRVGLGLPVAAFLTISYGGGLLGRFPCRSRARGSWGAGSRPTARRTTRSSSGATTRPSTCSPSACPACTTTTLRPSSGTSTRTTCRTASTTPRTAPTATSS